MNNDIFNNGLKNLEERFKNPSNEFRGKPFWSWNGELKKEELLRQVDILEEMGFGGYFMHSRCGLITEYLGKEWFELTNEISDYGYKKGMESWLYDEDRWPSGSAGGIATEEKKYRMKYLFVYDTSVENFEFTDDCFAVFIAEKSDEHTVVWYKQIFKSSDIKEEYFNNKNIRILKFKVELEKPSSVYNGNTYLNTLNKEATEKFIDVTHNAYKKNCKQRIGTSIKGIFTDEPHRGTALLSDKKSDDKNDIICSVCYTDDIFEQIEKTYGYNMIPFLPELFYKHNGERTAKYKHDFIDVADNLFIERFVIPIACWCKENNMEFTGHALHENSLVNQTIPQGSLMRFYQHLSVPGIDMLEEYDDCFWVAKQIQSVAHQLNQKWVLSELYGCTGWQFNFKSHKAVGNWQAVLGVNVRCPHLSWYTMEGESKRDFPASILHQSAWYKYYNYVESYFARFAELISEGAPVSELLVLNPIESVWTMAYVDWADWIFATDKDVKAYEEKYNTLCNYLLGEQIDFDLGEEFIMQNNAKVNVINGKPYITIGVMNYSCILISNTLTIRKSTFNLIKEFANLGGKVFVTGTKPYMIDALKSDEFINFAEQNKNVETVDFDACSLGKAISPYLNLKTDLSVKTIDDKPLICQVRECKEDNAYIVAIINTNRDKKADNIKLLLSGAGDFCAIEEWELETGNRFNINKDCKILKTETEINFNIEPAGTKTFVLIKNNSLGKAASKKTLTALKEKSFNQNVEYSLSEKNILVLDMVNADFNGKKYNSLEVLHLDMQIRDSLGLEHRSGEMLQPWLTKKKYTQEYGKLTLDYEFFIDELPKNDLMLAAERPEFYDYYINGEKLKPNGEFWTDICFKTLPISKSLLHLGKNVITAKTVFKRTTNIESVYILGDFGVKLNKHEQNITRRKLDKGRFFDNEKHIVSLPETIGFNDISNYNLPFYSGEISYIIKKEDILTPNVLNGEKLYIKVNEFMGALVKIESANHTAEETKEPKIIAWEPYEADITDFANQDIKVTLVCTRKNTFGPLHLVPAMPSSVGPQHFITEGKEYTDDYALIDSGIFNGVKFEIKK